MKYQELQDSAILSYLNYATDAERKVSFSESINRGLLYMFARDVVSSLLRRWYLTLFGLVATLALGFGVFVQVPPTYEMTADVVLLPPATSVLQGGNPYLQLDGLSQVVDVLTRVLLSQQTLDTVKKISPDSTYTVGQDATTSGPIMIITVNAPTKTEAAATLTELLNTAPSALSGLQTPLSIEPASQVVSKVLAKDKKPTTIGKTRLRFAVAAVGLGLVLTVLLVALVDGPLSRRRSLANREESKTKAGAAKPRNMRARRRGVVGRNTKRVTSDESPHPEPDSLAPQTLSEMDTHRSASFQVRQDPKRAYDLQGSARHDSV